MELACLAQLDRSHRRHDDVMERPARGGAPARRRAARTRAMSRPCTTRSRTSSARSRRHFLDEEGSVFPRLSTRRPELAEQLAALSAEHPPQIALQNAIARGRAQQLDGESRPGRRQAAARARRAARRRAPARTSRARTQLFASAHEALTAEDDAEIVAEMETRRDRRRRGRRRARCAVAAAAAVAVAAAVVVAVAVAAEAAPRRRPIAATPQRARRSRRRRRTAEAEGRCQDRGREEANAKKPLATKPAREEAVAPARDAAREASSTRCSAYSLRFVFARPSPATFLSSASRRRSSRRRPSSSAVVLEHQLQPALRFAARSA